MMSWQSLLVEIFTYGLLLYSIVLVFFYLFIAIFSINETRSHLRRNDFSDYKALAVSSNAPGVSIIAPAYNESHTIIENVRSLLSIHYEKLEIIIVNDGSKDDSMEKLISAYKLVKIPYFVNEQISARKIRGIYKSAAPAFHKLIIIDKENGGKADSLNAGVNIASNDLIVAIDVDCILEQDALLKIVKPFLDSSSVPVICSGGVIRIANSCEVENGRLVKVHLPREFLPRMQTLEYIRAFLLGRMAWSRLNGLLIVSGAFGAFDKEILIKSGGYDTRTVGEDMELVVRMRRYMEELNLPYRVKYIPDPLCWTEGPSDYKILGRQRNRWMRGTVETLFAHRQMFLNPNYHLLGMVSYPYWFFFEFLAPLIEFSGFIIFTFLALFHLVNWSFFRTLLFFIISFGYLYSVFGILMETLTYNQYKRRRDILNLLITAFLEPFIFHPFVVWSAIQGYIALYRKKQSWGEMTRKGFQKNKVQSSK